MGAEREVVFRGIAQDGAEAGFARRGQEGEEVRVILAAVAEERRIGMIAPGNEWLAERASQGDAAAFGDLAERHHAMLTAYVRSRVSNRADAQDVVQDTLLDAFRRLSCGRERVFETGCFGVWRWDSDKRKPSRRPAAWETAHGFNPGMRRTRGRMRMGMG